MSKYFTSIGFILGSIIVIFVMSTALSWAVYIVWQGLAGTSPPFWMFWSSCSIVFAVACFLSTIRRR